MLKNRINFVDIARAFAILFIVLGHTIVHSINCGTLFKFLYSFHVALFFIISGYVFDIKNDESFFAFVKKKFFRIMIPYFVWAILFLIPYMLFGQGISGELNTNSSFQLKKQIMNILYGIGYNSALKQNSSLWFLPALFSMEMINYFIIKGMKKHKKIEALVLLFSITISYITDKFLTVNLPWGINTVLTLDVFFLIGYLLKSNNLLTKDKILKLICIIPIFIVGIIAFIFNSTVSCIDYDYGNFILALLSGGCLSIVIIYIASIINKNTLLEYIGRNTMGILIFHKLIILVFQAKLGVVSKWLRNSNFLIEMLIGITVVVISVIFSLIATEIVRKILPEFIGEKRNK